MNSKLITLFFLIFLINSEITIYDNKFCLDYLDSLGYTELEVDLDDFYDICLNKTKKILNEKKYLKKVLISIINDFNLFNYEFYDI